MSNQTNKSDKNIKFDRYFIDQAQSEEASSIYDYPPSSPYYSQIFDLPETSFDTQAKMELIGPTKKEENTKKIFNVIYMEKIPIFTYIENESTDASFDSELSELKRTRLRNKRRRRDNRDNIRKKIKGGFFNRTLIKEINAILKRHNSKAYFERFPQKFIYDIARESNKKLLNFTLIEIFEKEEEIDYKEEMFTNKEKESIYLK